MTSATSTIKDFVERLSLSGIDLWTEGNRLRYRGRQELVTPELLSELKARKAELLEWLPTANEIAIPLSEGQRGLWFLHEMHPESAAYNVGFAAKIHGALDADFFAAAANDLVDQHPMLRAVFEQRDGEPVQRIVSGRLADYSAEDACGLDDEGLITRIRNIWQEAFRLIEEPPVRFRLLRRSDDSHVFVVSAHHIICDASSVAVIVQNLQKLYEERLSGSASDEDATGVAEFTEFIRQEQSLLAGPQREASENYWRQTLADFPTTLDLPTDKTRPPRREQIGAAVSFELEAELLTGLRRFSRSCDSTLFVTLLSAFQTLLHQWTGQKQLLVGSPMSLRSSQEYSQTVGYLVNPLPLAADFRGDPTLLEIITATKRRVREALDHRAFPFGLIRELLDLERDASRTPVFQVSFVHQQLGQSLGVSDSTERSRLAFEPWAIPQQEGQFDLVLEVVESTDRMTAVLKYDTALFDERTIERAKDRFATLLGRIADGGDCRLSQLPVVSNDEEAEVTDRFNHTSATYPLDAFLHELIEQQAARTPHAPAVRYETDSHALSYAELDRKSNQLANHLRSLGVGPETLVAICLERSVDLVVGLVGILKSGGAYVPLEPEYPDARLAMMLSDCQSPVVVTSASIVDRLTSEATVDIEPLTRSFVILDEDQPWWQSSSDIRPKTQIGLQSDQAAAYMIYTSGTTGKPKGVINRHRSIVNRLLWMQEQYGLDGTDRVLQKTPIGFDVSVWEFFWPLITGAELVMARPGGHRDGAYLVDMIQRSRVTTLHFVPPMLRALLEETGLKQLVDLRRVICSGEALDWDLQEAFFERMPASAQLWNLYGPTEAAVDVTVWQCRPQQRICDRMMVPIGRPISNTGIYIVNDQLRAVGVGVPGELLIGGEQVARGYHGRPSLTADRFVPNPFSESPGARLYRTGDLCRWLDDGVVEYLGRLDHQVKIRGIRIEPAEIENVIGEVSDIQGCVVSVLSGRLVAWVVGNTDGVLDHLRSRLPEAMVPSIIVPLEELPLSPNGKTDRKALPAPDWSDSDESAEYVAPTTREESIFAEIWQDLLSVDRVGVRDNFFALGGDSIQSTRLATRARSWGLALTVSDVFENQTIAQLAAVVRRNMVPGAETAAQKSLLPAITAGRASELSTTPLSFSQRRLWFLDRLEEKKEVYNIPSVMRLRGPLDTEVLQAALQRSVNRHESLRTVFPSNDGRPEQQVRTDFDVVLQTLSVSDSETARQLAAEQAGVPFDLANGPLIRAVLISIDPAEHILIIVMHHIISDGWSLGVLTREVSESYTQQLRVKNNGARRTDHNADSIQLVQLADYAAWQHEHMTEGRLESQMEYWKVRLADAPAVLELPTDRPRPPQASGGGSRVHFRVDSGTYRRITEIAGSVHATPFACLLSAFSALLHRWSGKDDLVIGSPVSGRHIAGTEDLVGCLINNLPVRCKLNEDPTFLDLLKDVRDGLVQDFANQDLPFEQLVDELQPVRDLSHSPLFQVMFVFQNQPFMGLNLPNVAAEFEPIELDVSKYDLTLTVVPADDKGLDCEFEYSTDLFDESTIRRTVDRFLHLVDLVTNNPDHPVRLLPIVSPQERNLVVTDFNRTETDFSGDRLLHHVIDDQARRAPNAPAVRFETDGPMLTYAELNCRANQLANKLQSVGAGPEILVGVYLHRSVDLIVSLLGILKSGAAYVPLDPDYPADRVRFMRQDSDALVVCTTRELGASLRSNNDQSGVSESRLLFVDHDEQWWSAASDLNPPEKSVDPNHAAYMIYTSGTTGQPKGVINSHRAIVNRLTWMQQQYQLTDQDRVLQKTPMSFDVSVWEFFWPLMTGAELIVTKPGGHRDGRYLVDLLKDGGITTVHFVPSMLRAVLEQPDLEHLTDLRRIICSGEALDWELQQQCFSRLPNSVELWNLYGPTEAAVDVTVWRCEADGDINGRHVVPIGRPLANTQIYILDESGHPVGVGVPGELHIAGVQVARGYHSRPSLTADKFVPDPFASDPGQRMYRSGDLCRWLDGGDIEYLGRIDHQVKIRGIRIELGEIEAVIAECEGVRACVVTVHESRLVAYVVGTTDGIQDSAKKKLPDAMIPSIIVPLETMPLTPAGKVDRRSLPAPQLIPIRDDAAFVAPRNSQEQILADVWAELLRVERVGVHDNFFELGGDSIISTQIVARAARNGLRLSVAELFRHQTIAELAAVAARSSDDAGTEFGREIAASGNLPLTPMSAWFIEQAPADDHHFNQSVAIQLPAAISTKTLAQGLTLLQERHPSLRVRLDRDAAALRIEEMVSDVEIIEPDTCTADTVNQWQASLDPVEGPVWRAVRSQPDRLLILAHHLAVDAVSWQIIAEDLAAICESVERNEAPTLPPSTASYRQWAFHQQERAISADVVDGIEFWERSIPKFRLPQDRDTAGTMTFDVDRSLDVNATRQLIHDAPAAFNNRINELLLAALARTTAHWAAASDVLIDIEGHGRDVQGVDVSRTVGWFTALRPVHLSLQPDDSVESLLHDVKRELRTASGGDSSYGLLRYMHPDAEIRSRLSCQPAAPILFNYLGNVDVGSTQESGDWQILPEIVGSDRSAAQEPFYAIEIVCIVRDGRLQLSMKCDGRRFAPATMNRLADAFVAEVRLVSDFCAAADAGGYSSVDFPLADIRQSTLNALNLPRRQIADLYPLSPMQEGMLYHSLLEAPAGVYFLQHVYRLNGAIDSDRLHACFQAALDSHSAWRTSFHRPNSGRPLQAVHRRLTFPWTDSDWRDVPSNQVEARIEEFLAQDRAKGMDLTDPPLIRATLCQLGDDDWLLFCSQHHLLVDGWSWSRALTEIFREYEAGIAQAASPPYRQYIEWLEKQDSSTALAWWQTTLSHFSGPTPLPWSRKDATVSSNEHVDTYSSVTRSLTVDETQNLSRFAREQRLTLNVVALGAWALLLSRCARTDSVLFGSTVAGRGSEFPGAEDIVGLMMNTLPVPVNVSSELSVAEWLRTLLDEQATREKFQYSSLAEIQANSAFAGGAALFDSVVVFENYPIDDAASASGAGIRITDARFIEGTNYPITVVVVPGDELAFTITYDTDRFDSDDATRIADQLTRLVTTLANSSTSKLTVLNLLDATQTQEAICYSSGAVCDESADCLHHPVERVARQSPASVALVDETSALTYSELDDNATRLAAWLQQCGVKREDRVGVTLPRSIDQVVALFAILKAGGVYVPLDSSLPRQRFDYLRHDSNPVLVLEEMPEPEQLPPIDSFVAPEILPQQTAYVIYTSGSTGSPKGVAVEHRAIVNHMKWMQNDLPILPDDVLLQKTPLSFDAAVWEIWGPLWAGAKLLLPAHDTHRDPEELLRWCRQHEATLLQLVPSQLRMLIDVEPQLESLASVRRLCCGGEPLSRDLVGAVQGVCNEVVNLYGPTEASIDSLFHVCNDDDDDGIPIGRPIANMQALILDHMGHPVPDGVTGELHLAGRGLARCYHDQPALTADRFVPNPYCDVPGSRLYRTGDLVRRRDDGNVEFVARVDDQIKLRGHRIELGEIDSTIRSLEFVADAATVVCEAPSGDQQLHSFFVPVAGKESSRESLTLDVREHLVLALPSWMVPGRIECLEELPKTPNGKIDRNALAALSNDEIKDNIRKAEFRTPREEIIGQIWMRHLDLSHLGPEDSFLDVGGHSLLATRIISELRSVFDAEVPLRWMFDSPTVAQLAARIDQLKTVDGNSSDRAALPPITKAYASPPVLSFAQQRFWLLDMIEGESGAWNMPAALRLRGSLNVEVLQSSLEQIVRRHEILRTRYELKGNETVPVVEAVSEQAISVQIIDADEDQIPSLIADHSRHRFDLTTAPTFHVKLLRIAEDDHVLLSVLHHISGDGWSMAIVVRELCAFYRAGISGEVCSLPDLEIQYRDYAHWQRRNITNETLVNDLAWWKEALQDAPALLELPTDRSRPATQTFAGASETFVIPDDVANSIRAVSRDHATTPFMTMLAVWSVLMARISGQRDLVVGTPVAGRDRQELESMVGCFLNTLPIRIDLSGDPGFVDLLDRVRTATLDSFSHQHVPFEQIVDAVQPERNLSYSPVFQVLFALQSQPIEAVDLPDVSVERLPLEAPAAKHDLSVYLEPSNDGFVGQLEFNTDLFNRSTIVRLAEQFVTLLRSAVANPQNAVSSLDLLDAAERQQILRKVNATEAAYPAERTITELIDERSQRHPQQESVRVADHGLSYEQLEARSNSLAKWLIDQNIGRGSLVAVCMPRSPELVVALLGVMKSGAAYVPLDPIYPEDRRQFMIEDSGAAIVLTELPSDVTSRTEKTDCGPPPHAQADDLAYVIYTSGSTGKPKGVRITHRNLSNFLHSMLKEPGLSDDDVMLAVTTVSFDIAALELFAPLLAGGRVVMSADGDAADGVRLAELLDSSRATVMQATPATWRLLLESGWDGRQNLRIFCGGEALHRSLAADLVEHGECLWNLYGPTETTIWSTIHQVTSVSQDDDLSTPIGRPIANTQIYVLDKLRRPVPYGVVGELYIGGDGVGAGYLNRPELTAERFVPDPYADSPTARMYRTGDLATLRPDGTCLYLGRTDNQVKLRGFRIELGEIEAALAEEENVTACAVVLRNDRLDAYIVPGTADIGSEPTSNFDAAIVRENLRKRLPNYMIPGTFTVLSSLPQTPNGKTDRHALPNPDLNETVVRTTFLAPTTEFEKQIAEIWSEVLGLERVGLDDNFFDLGGDSLKLAQVRNRLKLASGTSVPAIEFFQHPNVRALAGHLAKASEPQIEAAPVVATGSDRGKKQRAAFARRKVTRRKRPSNE